MCKGTGAAAAATGDRPARLHLKVETGLARNGIPPEAQRRGDADADRLYTSAAPDE